MLSKLNVFMCALALTSLYVSAQEKTSKTDAQPGTQAGNDKNRSNDEQPRSGENKARSADSQNPTERSQTRTTEGTTRTQGDRESRTAETRELRRTTSGDNNLDKHLAECLLMSNQHEVELSRFAAERAQNEKVKQFAQHMVEQHSEAIAKLQRFTGQEGGGHPASTESSRTSRSETNVNERSRTTTTTDQDRDATRSESKSANPQRDKTSPPEAAARTPADSTNRTPADANARTSTVTETERGQPGRAAGQPATGRDRAVTTSVEVRTEHEAMPDRMKAIAKEASEKCLALTKSKLEQSSNFDQAYMGGQIAAHIGAIAHLETYRSYASDELRQVIQEGHTMAQDHLRQATEIVEELGRSSASDSRREGRKGTNATSSETDATTPGKTRGEGGIRGRRADRTDSKTPSGTGKADQPGTSGQNDKTNPPNG